MMLGKRSRHNSVKRTTSLLEFTFDPSSSIDSHANPAEDDQILSDTVAPLQSESHQISSSVVSATDPWSVTEATCPRATGGGGGVGGGPIINHHHHPHHQMMHRRHSADFAQTLDVNTKDHIASHFLRDCSLCKRRLIPGRDIYMYRGDRAFCSSECRQQQISQDHRKEKLSSSNSLPKKDTAKTAAALPPTSPTSPSSTSAAAAPPKDVFVIGGDITMVTSTTATTATTMCN